MRHRVYKLDSRFAILGLEMSDIAVMIGAWMLGLQIIGLFLPARMKILVAIVITVIALKVWQLFKDRLPPKFGKHFLTWIAQADTYRVTADTDTLPLMVDPKQVLKKEHDLAYPKQKRSVLD